MGRKKSGDPMSWFFVAFTVLMTVYGQIVVKWKALEAGPLPAGFSHQVLFLLKFLLNPWILSGLAAGLLAALSWMAAMTKLPLSYAYPFTSLSFALVLLLSWGFFNEPITWPKVTGIGFIVLGLLISVHK
jgi:multidrug transporter EmrE-like cation transporter